MKIASAMGASGSSWHAAALVTWCTLTDTRFDAMEPADAWRDLLWLCGCGLLAARECPEA